jgi:integrase
VREDIDRSRVTVADYLDEWIAAHAVEIKPTTSQDYRHLIGRPVKPRIGTLRCQAIRPARLTRLHRDLVMNGGRNGNGLSPRTVEYVHAVLRKALRDAVLIEHLLPSTHRAGQAPPQATRRTGHGLESGPVAVLPRNGCQSPARPT